MREEEKKRLEDEKLKLLITSSTYIECCGKNINKYMLLDLLPIAHYHPRKQQLRIS